VSVWMPRAPLIERCADSPSATCLINVVSGEVLTGSAELLLCEMGSSTWGLPAIRSERRRARKLTHYWKPECSAGTERYS